MIKCIIVNFLIIFTNTLCFGQEFVFDKYAVYQVTYQSNLHDLDSKKSLQMELLLNDSISVFMSKKKRLSDSTLFYKFPEKANSHFSNGIVALRPVDKFAYTLVSQNDEILMYDSAFGVNMDGHDIIYHYNENISDVKWNITNETKMVGDIICQRATTQFGNRSWTVWFAPSIPIFEGPYKFKGLPGLVFSVKDESNSWSFDLISFEKKMIRHAINFQKWYVFHKKMKSELLRDRYTFQNSLIAQLSNIVDGNMNKEQRENINNKFIESIKNDNNWIEIYP